MVNIECSGGGGLLMWCKCHVFILLLLTDSALLPASIDSIFMTQFLLYAVLVNICQLKLQIFSNI